MGVFDNMPLDEAATLVITHRDRMRATFQAWADQVVNNWQPMIKKRAGGVGAVSALNPERVPSKTDTIVEALSKIWSPFTAQATNNMVSRLTRSGVKIDVALTNEAQQQTLSSITEKMAHGLIRQQDDLVSNSVIGQTWLRRAAGFAAMPGKLCGRVNSVRHDDTVDIEWELWDPVSVYHDFGRLDSHRVIHEELVETSEVKELLARLEKNKVPLNVPSDLQKKLDKEVMVSVADYYYEDKTGPESVVWNALCIEDICVAPPRVLKGPMWDHLPVFVRALNGLPAMHQNFTAGTSAALKSDGRDVAAQPNFVLDHARPWFADIEDTVKSLNLANSLELDAMWKAIHPPMIITSEGGRYTIEDKLIGPGVKIHLATGEQVLEYLELRTPSTEHFGVIKQLREDAVASYPRQLLSGEAAFPGQAGYHFFLQSDVMELVIMPFADGLADFIKAMIQESIHQIRRWAESGKVTIRLSARGTRGEQMGKWFEEDFDAGDISKSFSLSVKLSPQLPKDDARAVNIFNQVMSSGAMDEMSALANIMGDKDPVETIRRNKTKRAEDSPGMLALDELDALQKRLEEAETRVGRAGNDAQRQVRRVEARALRIQIASLSVRVLGQAPAEEQQAAIGGFPPETLPPELTTENPDQQAAAEGRPNAATGGRPRPPGAP